MLFNVHETVVSASLPALQEHEHGGWLAGGVSLALSVQLVSIFFSSTSWNTGKSLTTICMSLYDLVCSHETLSSGA